MAEERKLPLQGLKVVELGTHLQYPALQECWQTGAQK